MSRIVGREEDLATGGRFLAAVEAGWAGLILEGEAGIGKTTVWLEILRQAETLGHHVLTARPASAERELSLATLADLVGQVDTALALHLPDLQRKAFDALLLAEPAGDRPIQPRLLATAVRSLLDALAQDRPVVLAIDDIQWVDAASASVLGFVLRRVGARRIGLLATRRLGETVPEGLDGLPVTSATIGPMSVAGLHHVVREELGDAPSRPTMVRVHATAGGNPLFALEIIRLLREVGEPAPDRPLPVPGNVRELIAGRIRGLSRSVRESLLVAAAVAEPEVRLLDAVLGRDVVPDMESAEAEGLISIDRERVRFRHPLFGAAIYGRASDADRRSVHRKLASVLAGSEEGARHGALAVRGQDEEVAAALEEAAFAATNRGAPAAAAGLLEMAIGHTPDARPQDRERRMIARGDETARSGDTARAIAVLEEAIATATSPANRVLARVKLASIRYDLDSEPNAAFALCEAALAEPIEDIELLALVHATYAAVSWVDRARLAVHANEAMRLLDQIPDPDPSIVGLAIGAKVESDVDRHPVPDPALVKRALAAEERQYRPAVSERFSSSLGVFLKYADLYDEARPWLARTLQTAIDEGDEAGVPYALSHLPQLELWTGNWAKAEEYATRHLEVSAETGLEFQRRTAVYNLAIVHAHQGRVEVTREEIDGVLAVEQEGGRGTPVLLLATRSLLELSLGNLEAAVRDGQQASELRDQMGNFSPRRHESDVVEALAALGRLDEARALLENVERRAIESDLPTHRALAHRSRAVLEAASGDTDAALASIDRTFAEHERALNPFDRARTWLVLGQIRRRRRERRLASEALDAALAEFDRLGARLWAAKAHEELDRLGLRRGAGQGELTKMERRVAELAGEGRTNKDVAAELGISSKTVEAHLARAYDKLGIASRAELGARLGRLRQDGGGSARPS
jgi:DNA-binding CsgD family transcriptional regulator